MDQNRDDRNRDSFDRDLSPRPFEGQNYGTRGSVDNVGWPTAYDEKELNRRLTDSGFTDDELKQIPIIQPGVRLELAATYLDLANPALGEFTARGDEITQPGQWIVPKSTVPYETWNRLLQLEPNKRL